MPEIQMSVFARREKGKKRGRGREQRRRRRRRLGRLASTCKILEWKG
jgi:hypothetical protein